MRFTGAAAAVTLALTAFAAGAYDYVDERGATVSRFSLSEHCRTPRYERICHFVTMMSGSRFEKEVVERRNAELLDDAYSTSQGSGAGSVSAARAAPGAAAEPGSEVQPDADTEPEASADAESYSAEYPEFFVPPPREKLVQDVSLEIRPIPEIDLAVCITRVVQHLDDGVREFYELFNIKVKTEGIVTFRELFRRADLARMLCARKIEEHFAAPDAPRSLLTVVTATEVMPHNYMILPDGLEFVFRPGLVSKSGKAERIFVDLDDLRAAVPQEQWFPGLKKKSWYEQDYKHNLTNGLLRGLVRKGSESE